MLHFLGRGLWMVSRSKDWGNGEEVAMSKSENSCLKSLGSQETRILDGNKWEEKLGEYKTQPNLRA